MAEEKKSTWRTWFWRGSAVLLVVVFFVARTLTRDRIPVHAVGASRAELTSVVSTNGMVEPVRNIEFHSPLPTTVRAIYVRSGDQVEAGKLLMQLDDMSALARAATAESALRSAQAGMEAALKGGTLEERQALASNVTRAKMDVAQAAKNLAALEKLQATGAASASEVSASKDQQAVADDALRTLEERQRTRYSATELERARAQVADAEANLKAAREVVEQTSIKAPVAGTVYSIPVGHSDFVQEGQLLLQMADLKNVRVRAYFDEPEIGKLAVGQKINIRWDARHEKEWHGHVEQVPSTIITYGTRNVGEVIVAIDDAERDLLPDTHVTVTVTTAREPNALTVPREALRSENGKPYVFRVVGDELKRTPVVTGTINLTQVAITSGLTDGEMVATGSLNGLPLEEGVQVKVVR